MILYHGTNSKAAGKIMWHGFRGSELTDMTDGFSTSDTGVVFMTDSIKEAKGYGDAIFAIEIDDPTFFQDCPTSNAKEYYADVDKVNKCLITRVGSMFNGWTNK